MKSFIVVELKPGGVVPVQSADGKLLTFTDGAEAAAHATDLSVAGAKFQPRPVLSGDWRKREQTRLDGGDYKVLPWAKERWWRDLKDIHKDHYPHAAIYKGASIAFTESEEKGNADIQTPMRPGKYLERYFGSLLSQYVIRDLCTEFSAKYEDNMMLFAEGADEIEEVYINGPTSCMSKTIDSYPASRGTHPVRVYDAGDLKVAYLRHDGKVSARTVIWPEKKIYNPTIYGDSGRLRPLLEKEGYKASPPFGARLAKIKVAKDKSHPAQGYAYVCPHVDGVDNVHVQEDFLILGNAKEGSGSANIIASGPNGVTEWLGCACARCANGDLPARLMVTVIIDDGKGECASWCQPCRHSHAVQDPNSGRLFDKQYGEEVSGRLWWAKSVKDYTFVCAGSGKRTSVDRCITLHDGDKWSTEHFRANGKYCDECGKAMKRSETCACATVQSNMWDAAKRVKDQQTAYAAQVSILGRGSLLYGNTGMTIGQIKSRRGL